MTSPWGAALPTEPDAVQSLGYNRRVNRTLGPLRLVSFDAYRTLEIPGARYIKPEHLFRHRAEVAAADWVLFPEYWQVNALAYGLKRRIFPGIASYHLGHDKVEMTRVLEATFPQHVPWTEIRAATESGVAELLELFEPPFIVKEVRSSCGSGVHRIDSRCAFRDYDRVPLEE